MGLRTDFPSLEEARVLISGGIVRAVGDAVTPAACYSPARQWGEGLVED